MVSARRSPGWRVRSSPPCWVRSIHQLPAADLDQRAGADHRRRHGQPARRGARRIALIGLPELLREFGEYRYLFYGAALVIMMRLRRKACGRPSAAARTAQPTKRGAGGGSRSFAGGPNMSGEPVLLCSDSACTSAACGGGCVDLAVADGSIHSIIGPNGAGKTTLFNCITQNLQPTSGSVRFRGERIDGLTPDRVAAAGISRTYQNIRLFRNITAIENLLVGMHLHLRSTWWGAVFGTPRPVRDEKRAHEEALRCCISSGCAGVATCWRATSPMASSAGWRSAARWRRSRGCCCWMNRPRE